MYCVCLQRAGKSTWYLGTAWHLEEYKRERWLSESGQSHIWVRTWTAMKNIKMKRNSLCIFQIPIERLTHCFYLVIRTYK